MTTTMQDVQELLGISRNLDEMRDDITRFVAILIKPFFTGTAESFEWNLESPKVFDLESGSAAYLSVVFNGSTISLTLFKSHNFWERQDLSGKGAIATIPLKFVEPVWRALPRVQEFLSLIPAIQERIEEYKAISKRRRAILE